MSNSLLKSREYLSRSLFLSDLINFSKPSRAFSTIIDPYSDKKVIQHPYTTGGKKGLTGFSFPVPRKLEDIIKYALLEREPATKIKEVWNGFHDSRVDSVATSWSKSELEAAMSVSKRNRSFLFPVFKGDGKYFTLFAEWQDKYLIMCFLDDYRRSPGAAEPYFSLAVYDDFVTRKGIALVRGDYSAHLNKLDAAHLLNLVRHFYIQDPKMVETFNKDPSSFNWERFLAECPRPIQVNEIKDAKKLVKHS